MFKTKIFLRKMKNTKNNQKKNKFTLVKKIRNKKSTKYDKNTIKMKNYIINKKDKMLRNSQKRQRL